VGERSYLAIGDVLALLREEFPDITISKIRFLESRGLLVPERTPSGYRKFYEPDVERLRWILRQQREHFLPLKVIKGRLDHGMSDPEAPAPHLFEMGEPPPERESEAVLVAAAGASAVTRESAQGGVAALTPVAMVASSTDHTAKRATVPIMARADAAPQAEPGSQTGPTGSTHEGGHEERHSTTVRRSAEAETKASGSTGSSGGRRGKGQAPVSESASLETEAESSSTGAPAEEGQKDTAVPARRAVSRPTAGLPGAGLSGASLTLSELASASGLEVAGIEELESFGLIAGRTVAGVHCYDDEAVLVAKLAARFAPYGIGARHLRIFKHAADRQTGLFAQVVTPLLRQRNPGARARAIEDLSELAELGEALMRCFSQAALRELTGG